MDSVRRIVVLVLDERLFLGAEGARVLERIELSRTRVWKFGSRAHGVHALLAGACLLACSKSEPAPSATSPSAAPTTEAAPKPSEPTPAPAAPPVASAAAEPAIYAVFDVKSDDVLNVRAEADSKSKKVYSYGPSVKTIHGTGRATDNGSTHWVEVTFEGGAGWVNRAYLTERKPGGGCNDAALTAVIRQFMRAVANTDGGILEESVSPLHGLLLRYDATSPQVRIPRDKVSLLFTSSEPQNYGTSSKPFKAVVLPTLKEAVSGKGAKETCGKLLLGPGASGDWPNDLTGLTYVSFHSPGAGGNWTTWVAGLEYIDGKPFVAALVGYRAGS